MAQTFRGLRAGGAIPITIADPKGLRQPRFRLRVTRTAGWRPDGSGRAEWRDAGFSPRRKGRDLSLPQPDYPLTLTSLSPGERVSRLYRDG